MFRPFFLPLLAVLKTKCDCRSDGLEVEYQVPTSSQRDQEDDILVISDEEDDMPDDGVII